MTKTVETSLPLEPPPVRISRTLHAPRELVFRAWSSADHMKRWFAPAGFTVPQAKVEMRVGGPFEVLMRAPDGVQHWARGKFVEVSKFDRLTLDLTVEDVKGHALFRALTEASFSEALGGTRIDVTQTYTVLDPDAAWMATGAPRGWAETLDNLSTELRRMQEPGETSRSVVHAAFTLERTYDAPVERVYRALSDEAAKARWFGGEGAQWRQIERSRISASAGANACKAVGKAAWSRPSTRSTTTSCRTSGSSTATKCISTAKRSQFLSPRCRSIPPVPAAPR
jgi:uncharacterized protein YndB with AHSA1/START domain